MPTLPTITVTDAQAQRMLGAYGSTAAYTQWLKNAIIDYVLNQEYVAKQQAAVTQWDNEFEQGRTELGYVQE